MATSLYLVRKHEIYAILKKCIFGAPEIPILGCFVGKVGVCPDPKNINAIVEGPTPTSVKGNRKFLRVATYLHEY